MLTFKVIDQAEFNVRMEVTKRPANSAITKKTPRVDTTFISEDGGLHEFPGSKSRRSSEQMLSHGLAGSPRDWLMELHRDLNRRLRPGNLPVKDKMGKVMPSAGSGYNCRTKHSRDAHWR